MRKTQMLITKPVNLRVSILDLSKSVVHEFSYGYVKPKYSENEKLCYIDTDSLIVHVKTNVIYIDIAQDIKTRFDTSNFQLDRPFPKRKNKTVIGLVKDELAGKLSKQFVGLTAKLSSYLKDNNDVDEKGKGTKKCVIKRKLSRLSKLFRSSSN